MTTEFHLNHQTVSASSSTETPLLFGAGGDGGARERWGEHPASGGHPPRQAVNPDGIRNQTQGGIIQSLSWTLYEEVCFNEMPPTTIDWASALRQCAGHH